MTQPLKSTTATTDTGRPTVLSSKTTNRSAGHSVTFFSRSDGGSAVRLDVRLPRLSDLSTSKSGLTPVSPHNAVPWRLIAAFNFRTG
jgi:hypothetical protein